MPGRKRLPERDEAQSDDMPEEQEEEEEEEEMRVTRTRSRSEAAAAKTEPQSIARKRQKGEAVAEQTPEHEPANSEDEDSDDAPEEVTMSQARDESIAAHKAEVEGRKRLAEQKRAMNRRKEENLKQAKEVAANKQAETSMLPSEFLAELQEEEVKRKKEAAARKKPKQNKTIKFGDSRKERVERGGFVLQKVRSNKQVVAHERKSVAEEATAMLSAHFGKIARKEYAAVHSRRFGPGRSFEL